MKQQSSYVGFDFANIWGISNELPYIKVITGLEWNQRPSTSIFERYQSFNVLGGSMTAFYNDGSSQNVDVTSKMVTGFNTNNLGSQTLTVTFQYKKLTYDVTVVSSLVTSITMNQQPNKNIYYQGESLDLTGASITATNIDNSSQIINLKPSMVNGYDPNKPGKQSIMVTYEGYTTSFEVTVLARSIVNISMNQQPTNINIIQTNPLDLKGATITITYDEGPSEIVNVSSSMVSGFDTNTPGVQTLTVTYQGHTTTFDVTVLPRVVTSMTMSSEPTKKSYAIGKSLEVSGAKIKATYNDGSSQVIDVTTDMVTGFDSSTFGNKTIIITYQGFTTTFIVTVVNPYPFDGGDGTVSAPYQVSTKTQLDEIRNNLSAYYILTTDIAFTAADFASGGAYYNNGQGWDSIGTNLSNPFTGSFDGDGHTISGLTHYYTEQRSDDYAGLFAYNCGTIKNLGMVNNYISGSTSYGTKVYVGAIAAVDSGFISNCYNTGSIYSKMSNPYAILHLGGIVGWKLGGRIDNCYNTGSITCAANNGMTYLGGIVGKSDFTSNGNISNCYNTGSVSSTLKNTTIGGIVGYSNGILSNCYNSGMVSSTSGSEIGGITGYNNYYIYTCYFINSTATGSGSGSSSGTKALSLDQMKQQSSYIGFDFTNKWAISDGLPYLLPFNNQYVTSIGWMNQPSKKSYSRGDTLDFSGATIKANYNDWTSKTVSVTSDMVSSFNPYDVGNQTLTVVYQGYTTTFTVTVEFNPGFVGNGTISNPYQVTTKDQLDAVRYDLSANYILMNDIEFISEDFSQGGVFYNSGAEWKPIGTTDAPFKGVFDGNGHTISGLVYDSGANVNDYENLGLFGMNSGTIKNLGMIKCNIIASSSSYYTAYVGAIAGQNNGTIKNCYNTGVVGGKTAGGITGFSTGPITNCYNTGTISGDTTGGIVGNIACVISNCYNSGAVSGTLSGGIAGFSGGSSSISLSYNNGDVSASTNAGGIVGEFFYTATNCYNSGSISGSIAGGIGGASGNYTTCYNVGKITSTKQTYTGGIVGFGYDSSIKNCYYINIVKRQNGLFDNGKAGSTSAQMKQLTVYSGFDFANVWKIDNSNSYGYPILIGSQADVNPTVGFTIVFHANGGNATTMSTYPSATAVSAPNNKPTLVNHAFVGWFTAASGGSQITFPYMVDKNTNLYAHWTPNMYTATFDTNGGSAIPSETVKYDVAVSDPPIPTKDGYVFDGWYTEANGGNPQLFPRTIDGPKTFYAHWKIDSFTVTFNTNGGSADIVQSAEYNSKITEPTAPTRDNYTFTGWYTTETGGEAVVFPYTVENNVTLFAQWQEIVPEVPTGEKEIVPEVPTGIKAIKKNYNTITISWIEASGANGYKIYRSTTSTGTYTLLNIEAVKGTSYVDTGLSTGTRYYYKVIACQSVNGTSSEYSAFVSAKPTLTVPTKLKVKKATKTSVKVKWKAVAGASGYKVYRATSAKGAYKAVASVKSRSYTNRKLKKGKTYYYKVKAYRTVNKVKVYGGVSTIVRRKM